MINFLSGCDLILYYESRKREVKIRIEKDESRKREVKIRLISEGRSDERLKSKVEDQIAATEGDICSLCLISVHLDTSVAAISSRHLSGCDLIVC